MSILDALKETRRESKNLSELALLPQALIMQMAQRGELSETEVPLIIGKKAELIEAAARNAALAQSGQVPPTVMEKNMMTIAQDENPAPPQEMQQQPMMPPEQMMQAPQLPEDVGIAQNPVPPMQMAGGGIIAFDEGGDVDEEEDEYNEMLEKAREDDFNEQIYSMLFSRNQDQDAGPTGITPGFSGADEGIKDSVGDVERLRAQIMQKESGGRRYDKQGNLLTSSKGALGEMQVMPATARDPGFGIKPAKNNSPDELRRVGDEYAEILLNRYRDPKLAMIAYNMGPGATDKWLAAGADPRKLPKETQGYIRGVNLAEGGEVKRFQVGGTMGGFDDAYTDMGIPLTRPEIDEYTIDPMTGEKSFSGYRTKSRTKPPKKDARKANDAETEQFFEQFRTPTTTAIPQSPEGVKELRKEASEEGFNLMKYIQDRQAKMDKAAEKDKWQAGLAAGLGMLGGTSQYALENIGKGGQLGVQQLAQLQKTRAAQEAATGKLYGTASQAEIMNKIRRDQLEENREIKDRQMAQRLLTEKNEFIQKRLKSRGMDEMILNNLRLAKATGKLDPAKQAQLDHYERQIRDIEREANRMFAAPGSGMRVVGVR
jgi:hypothetical protein